MHHWHSRLVDFSLSRLDRVASVYSTGAFSPVNGHRNTHSPRTFSTLVLGPLPPRKLFDYFSKVLYFQCVWRNQLLRILLRFRPSTPYPIGLFEWMQSMQPFLWKFEEWWYVKVDKCHLQQYFIIFTVARAINFNNHLPWTSFSYFFLAVTVSVVKLASGINSVREEGKREIWK